MINNIKIAIVLLSFFLTINCFSQTPAACMNAQIICSDSAGFQMTVGGTGLTGGAAGPISNPTINPQGVNAGCDYANAPGPHWLTFTIAQSGNLGFCMGGPSSGFPQTGYYDWVLWRVDTSLTKSCNHIFNNNLAPVSCNWNANSTGGTGMGPIPSGGDPGNFQPSIPVTAGQQYILIFSNYSGVNGGVKFVRTGSAEIGCGYTITMPPSQTICQGQSAVITPTFSYGSNPSFTLLPGNIVSNNNFTLSPSSSSMYTIIATNTNTNTNFTYTSSAIYSLIVSTCTEVRSHIKESIQTFPNPFNNELHIDFNYSEAIKEIVLYNLLGEQIMSIKNPEQKLVISTDHISNGVYFMKVTGDKYSRVIKIIRE